MPAASQPSVPSTSRRRLFDLARRHELANSRRCSSPWRRFGAEQARAHIVRDAAPHRRLQRAAYRCVAAATYVACLPPRAAARCLTRQPMAPAAYRLSRQHTGQCHRDSIFDPTLSTLLAGPHGPTVVCAVPGCVAAPSPLNIRISYEQTGDCLFSRSETNCLRASDVPVPAARRVNCSGPQ